MVQNGCGLQYVLFNPVGGRSCTGTGRKENYVVEYQLVSHGSVGFSGVFAARIKIRPPASQGKSNLSRVNSYQDSLTSS